MPSRKRSTQNHADITKNKKARQMSMSNGNSTRTTRSMTTDAARRAVFNTAELLEAILLHLSFINIFPIQRVSKQFRDVVAKSTPVQIRLFCVIDKSPRRTWIGTGYSLTDPRESEPPEFPLSIDLDGWYRVWDSLAAQEEPLLKVTPMTLCPLLARTDYGGLSYHSPMRKISTSGERCRLVRDLYGVRREHASWRDLFLTNPPIRRVSVSVTFKIKRPKKGFLAWTIHGKAYKEDGLTLGAVFEQLLASVQNVVWRDRRKKTERRFTAVGKAWIELEREFGSEVYIDSSQTEIHLLEMVIPSDWECWEVQESS